ncbi:hypothetical protein SAMN04488126_12920 [Bhargavaea beijingensis]|uniref:Uncharacterized protein n=1 Tax=Bhargavaea beijingensis TaxID=426756 RepID=A0A1G7GTP1_9BACL|nr:hypothetical protein SAMN04488126_12920 [Bhargavaea beijingensis]
MNNRWLQKIHSLSKSGFPVNVILTLASINLYISYFSEQNRQKIPAAF